MTKATLKFPPGTVSGFTGTQTAGFNDVQPVRVVRELLQNSLDAAVEAGEAQAIVHFTVTRMQAVDLPDMAGYRRAFERAVADNEKDGGLSDAAQEVVERIRDALDSIRDGRHYLLGISDNGVGLDRERMTALLSDGASRKQTNAVGSYGVGHFAAVSASDLRYLLYGGVQDNGRRIAAGFTVLASRHGNNAPISAQGYLIKKILGGSDGPFEFMASKTIPRLMGDALKRIRKTWRHGSVVFIPAFNYFGRDFPSVVDGARSNGLSDIVAKVAAYNFSAAIHAGNLVVEINEEAVGGDTRRVDGEGLPALLEKERERVRVHRRETFFEGLRPSGLHAWAAYKTLSEGRRATVRTMLGTATVNWIEPAPAGATRIDLFRNGMWITDDVPELHRGNFADCQPFHMVVQPDQGDLHRLLRKAEGPMHDQLALRSRLGDKETEQLTASLKAIGAWIKSRVPKIQTEQYTPDDFLQFASDADGAGNGTRQFSLWGTPVVVQTARPRHWRPDPDGTHDIKSGGRQPQLSPKRPKRNERPEIARSRPLPLRSTVVRRRPGRYHIEIECDEASEDVLLSVRVDENADATCDRVWPDENVVLKSVKLTGREHGSASCSLEDNTVIRLKGLAEKTTYKLSVACEMPRDLTDAVRTPVLRVDLHKPQFVEGEMDGG